MRALLVIVLVTTSWLGLYPVGMNAGGSESNYRKWPICRKGVEYVEIVENPVNGEFYHTWNNSRRKVKYYVCQRCTDCPFGVQVLASCSTHLDTNCSSTCAVQGCIMDEHIHLCRLPGDPSRYPSISAMTKPCRVPAEITSDLAKLNTDASKTTGPAASLGVQSTLTIHEEGASNQNASTHAEPTPAPTPRMDLFQILVTSVLVIVMIAIIIISIAVSAILVRRRQHQVGTSGSKDELELCQIQESV